MHGVRRSGSVGRLLSFWGRYYSTSRLDAAKMLPRGEVFDTSCFAASEDCRGVDRVLEESASSTAVCDTLPSHVNVILYAQDHM